MEGVGASESDRFFAYARASMGVVAIGSVLLGRRMRGEGPGFLGCVGWGIGRVLPSVWDASCPCVMDRAR